VETTFFAVVLATVVWFVGEVRRRWDGRRRRMIDR
jgi:hypothetical protein